MAIIKIEGVRAGEPFEAALDTPDGSGGKIERARRSVAAWGVPNTSGSDQIQVEIHPQNPLAGQAVHVAITDGGFVVDDVADIGYEVIWGDENAVYTHGATTKDATRTRGRVVQHVYATPGEKTLTVRTKVAGQPAKERAFTVNVGDPETVNWAKQYYVDLTGDATGMPAETGSIEHVLSWSDWAAMSLSSGTNVRIFLRAGKSHALAPADSDLDKKTACDILYIERFGSGSDPELTISSAFSGGSSYRMFLHEAGQSRVIFKNIHLFNDWDPITGLFNTRPLWGYMCTDQDDVDVSFYRCTMEKMTLTAYAGSPGDLTGSIAFVDCKEIDHQDYMLLASLKYVGATGCDFYHSPFATVDPQKGHGSEVAGADHATMRVGRFSRFGMSGVTTVKGPSGWAAAPPEIDGQAFLRLHQNDSTAPQEGWIASLYDVDCGGPVLMEHTTQNGDDFVTGWGTCILDSCRMAANRNAGSGGWGCIFVQTNFGGVKAQNCVVVAADLKHSYVNDNFSSQLVEFRADSPNVSERTMSEPSLIRNNNAISEKRKSSRDLLLVNIVSGTDWQISEWDNILSAQWQKNAASLPPFAAFNGNDGFRAVTGSAADIASTGMPPCWDFDGLERDVTSKAGAHRTTGAAGIRPNPDLTAATIAEFRGKWTVRAVEGANLDDNLLGYDWRVDGANPAAGGSHNLKPFYTYDAADAGKTLTCIVTASNLSGTVDTIESNAITLP